MTQIKLPTRPWVSLAVLGDKELDRKLAPFLGWMPHYSDPEVTTGEPLWLSPAGVPYVYLPNFSGDWCHIKTITQSMARRGWNYVVQGGVGGEGVTVGFRFGSVQVGPDESGPDVGLLCYLTALVACRVLTEDCWATDPDEPYRPPQAHQTPDTPREPAT